MNIINGNNNIKFGSIYQYNVTKDNSHDALCANGEISELEMTDYQNYTAFEDFMPYNEMAKTGIIYKMHIAADDKYDDFIESVLRQRNIDFVKYSIDDVVKPEAIYNRIVLPEHASKKVLVSLDTEKVEKLFRQNKDFYIAPNGSKGTIGNRYEAAQKYFKTGRYINASEIYLHEENDKPVLSITDGRHRFAVMRDMGMKKIKFALDKNSLEIAYKYNLISE